MRQKILYHLIFPVILIVFSFFCGIVFSYAADFSRPFVEDSGKAICAVPLKDGEECAPDRIFTLRVAARNALYMTFEDEKNLSGDDKYARAELATRLREPDPKLKAEDLALIKRLIAKLYGPAIVYQAWRELDPK